MSINLSLHECVTILIALIPIFSMSYFNKSDQVTYGVDVLVWLVFALGIWLVAALQYIVFS